MKTSDFKIGGRYTYSHDSHVWTCIGFSIDGKPVVQETVSPAYPKFIQVNHPSLWKKEETFYLVDPVGKYYTREDIAQEVAKTHGGKVIKVKPIEEKKK